jgi:hypothetical protein
MSLQSIVGTPDWQRGVVNAQKLLAAEVGTSTAVTVGVPLNTEVILVYIPGTGPVAEISTVLGVSSGDYYPSVLMLKRGGDFSIYAIPVAPSVDPSITITLNTAPGAEWYVVSDTGGRFVADMAIGSITYSAGQAQADAGVGIIGQDSSFTGRMVRVDVDGRLVPTPGQILYSGLQTVTGSKLVIAAPPAGYVNYVHGVEMTNPNAGLSGMALEDAGGTWLCYASVAQGQTVPVSLNGVAVTSGVTAVCSVAGGQFTVRWSVQQST